MTPNDLLLIPGGEFLMGQENGRDEERPAHLVTVAPFSLCRYQVTNEDFAAFREFSFECPALPVTSVSWFDAVEYCRWLAGRWDREVRLPSEAEWEFAARGGMEQKLYPWGDAPYVERANYAERWREGPEPVGTSEPNGYGLFDMCENVHEWCSDWYDPAYYLVSPADNPQGPDTGTRRASRGGAWRHHIKVSRCAARSSIPPEFRYADYGFRVAGRVELDEGTVQRIDDAAARLAKPKSQIVREAVADYHSRISRLSESERQRMLKVFDTMVPLMPTRPQQEVEDELREIRRARRAGGRAGGRLSSPGNQLLGKQLSGKHK